MNVKPLYQKDFSLSFQSATQQFLIFCQARNLKPRTLEWYKERFRILELFLNERYPHISFEALTSTHLREFLIYLRKERNSQDYTIKKTYDALRAVFGFLSTEKILLVNPMEPIPSPRVTQKLVKPLEKEDVERLLKQPDKTTFTGFRDYVLLVLFLDTGLRLNEALGMKVSDVNVQEGTLLVFGKGRKERKVPFGQTLRGLLTTYLQRRGTIPGQDLVFVNQYGQKLTARRVQDYLKRYARLAGIQKPVHPHLLRHTFALNFILQGGNPFVLQEILGHTTLDMTRRYVSLANQSFAGQRVSFMDKLAEQGQASLPKRKLF